MSTTSTTKRLYGTVTTPYSDVLFDSYENIISEVINKLLVKQGGVYLTQNELDKNKINTRSKI